MGKNSNVVSLAVVADIKNSIEDVEQKIKGKTMSIPLSLIKTNEKNNFGMRDIEKLANSIKEEGLLHNIVVREIEDPQFLYEIISGERRFRAAELNNWAEIEAKVVEANDLDSEIMLIKANLETRVLNDMERSANAIRLADLIKEKRKNGENFAGKKTREVIADEMKIPPAQVQKLIKIQELIEEFKEMVRNNVLGLETANQYAQMEPSVQLMIYKSIQEGMSYTAKEAKEIKDKLQTIENDKQQQQQLIDELSGKVKDFEVDKKKALSELQVKYDKELKTANEDKDKVIKELQDTKSLIEEKQKLADKEVENIKVQLKKEIEAQNGKVTEEQQHKLDELQKKLDEAEKSKDEIKKDLINIENENEKFIIKLGEEQKDLVIEYEKKIDKVKSEFKEREIKQINVEYNMELLALSKQVNQLLSTLVSKVAQAKAMQDFEMTDEVKSAVTNVTKFSSDVARS